MILQVQAMPDKYRRILQENRPGKGGGEKTTLQVGNNGDSKEAEAVDTQ